MGFSRYYPAVSVGVWLPNSNRQSFIDLIVRKTIENPDYVMIPIFKKDTVEKTAEDMKRPISTDDFLRSINEVMLYLQMVALISYIVVILSF